MILKPPTPIALSLLLGTVLAASAAAQVAQQKRQTPAKTQAPPVATPAPTPPLTPTPTFDTLLPANSYPFYGEIRSVGQFVRSNSVNEILEPIMKLAGPPKEFRTVVKWLNAHADEVMSSRMLVASGRAAKDVPSDLAAIEFASAEEAARFQQRLNEFLKAIVPAPSPSPTGETNKTAAPPPPPYHLQQAGSLILITPTPLNLQKLRPAGSKLLSEDANFRVARNRFNSESIFIFVDVAQIEKEEVERRKRFEEARKELVIAEPDAEAIEKVKAEVLKTIEEAEKAKEESKAAEPPPPDSEAVVGVELKSGPADGSAPSPMPQQLLTNLTIMMSSISSAEATWPQAVGVGISLESDSFDVRALLVNKPGEKSDPLPFLPLLAPGPAITPDAPNVLPADTEMLVTLSLDLPHIYATMAKPEPRPQMQFGTRSQDARGEDVIELDSPVAAIEKQLKLNLKDDLLPLLGSEIVVSVPLTGVDWFQPPPPSSSPSSPSPATSSPSPDAVSSPSPSSSPNAGTPEPSKPKRGVAVALSLKDKEGMRALLPKIIESLAFKGANSFAQTERREDTELVSYANLLSYAFIGNFLIISPEAATTRHIVDSYLKRQTLSGDPHFKNYTRWQPRQLQAQLYVSPVLMETYRTWVQQPNAPIDDQTRAFLTRFTVVPQPVTYSLSNEGFGPLHELHLPKNLVLLFIAATAGTANAPPVQPDLPSTSTPNPPPAKPANPY